MSLKWIRYEITLGTDFGEPGGGFTYLATAFFYVYDGFRVIQERNALGPLVSYTRGNDLSGSLEGSGGIGGLLAESTYSFGGPSAHYYYFADGNGNVTYMLDNSQSIVASYRYDPFGNTISKSGTLADDNVYRFSSKEFHVNSGLYYFGYRFYDPSLQRWINRDPAGENGGINLFAFVGNDGINKIDSCGLETSIAQGEPHISDDRHHNYLIFHISCPKCYKVSNVTADYNDQYIWDNMYAWFLENANAFLVTPPEARYISMVKGALTLFGGSSDFGGIQDAGTPNCNGDPVEVHAYMRTRLVAPGSQFQEWRSASLVPNAAINTRLYEQFTKIHYTCEPCKETQ